MRGTAHLSLELEEFKQSFFGFLIGRRQAAYGLEAVIIVPVKAQIKCCRPRREQLLPDDGCQHKRIDRKAGFDMFTCCIGHEFGQPGVHGAFAKAMQP